MAYRLLILRSGVRFTTYILLKSQIQSGLITPSIGLPISACFNIESCRGMRGPEYMSPSRTPLSRLGCIWKSAYVLGLLRLTPCPRKVRRVSISLQSDAYAPSSHRIMIRSHGPLNWDDLVHAPIRRITVGEIPSENSGASAHVYIDYVRALN